MKRIALVSSEPIRPRMGGIGIRYAGFARQLPALGFEVVLVCPEPDIGSMDLPVHDVHAIEPGRLAHALAGCDVALAQGHHADTVIREAPGLPIAIDLYDPWLVENLHYAQTLGYGPYRNDHASWVLQMSRGDFFLCSSETQRLYYLGFLTALGRVNPDSQVGDRELRRLIDIVPFGVPDAQKDHMPYLPASRDKRILCGGLYDWYDPWTLLHAVEKLPFTDWQVLFMRSPNPDTTPQGLAREVERKCGEREPWKSRVRFLDWAPDDRRFDLMRDVSALAAPHHHTLETRLSMRTRYLDALSAGCPVVMTQGDDLSRLVAEHEAGWTVPAEDPDALAAALTTLLTEPEMVRKRSANARALVARFTGPDVLAPLLRFFEGARVDPTKEAFAFPPGAPAPRPTLAQAGRRLWRRMSRRRPTGEA